MPRNAVKMGSLGFQSRKTNTIPPSIDEKHRAWLMDKMFTPRGPQDAVDQLIHAAFECAVFGKQAPL